MEDSLDLSEFASTELEFEQAVELGQREKFWGFSNGMFIGGNDDLIALRFHHGFSYEPVSRELWRRVCKGAEVVCDIGTHSGIFSLEAYRAGAKACVSIEPHPINFARMVLNLRHNGFPFDGAVFGAAGDEDKVSHLLVKSLWRCEASGRMGLSNKNGCELPSRSMRLDSILSTHLWPKLRAVKIDAENWTPNVLAGMSKILKDHRPDLIVESTQGLMTELLTPYGYKFWKVWETGKVEPCEDLKPHNPDNKYNGTDENCKNRFCSVRGLPNG